MGQEEYEREILSAVQALRGSVQDLAERIDRLTLLISRQGVQIPHAPPVPSIQDITIEDSELSTNESLRVLAHNSIKQTQTLEHVSRSRWFVAVFTVIGVAAGSFASGVLQSCHGGFVAPMQQGGK